MEFWEVVIFTAWDEPSGKVYYFSKKMKRGNSMRRLITNTGGRSMKKIPIHRIYLQGSISTRWIPATWMI